MQTKPSQAEILLRFTYVDGKLLHKRNKKQAGYLHKSGYRYIKIDGKLYPEHHIVWCYHTGQFPKEQIDHINHIRDDNHIENLREVSCKENAKNRTRRQSRVDEAGIWYCKRRKRYIAEITVDGKKVYQRTFININDAIASRSQKLIELNFHPNHGKSL